MDKLAKERRKERNGEVIKESHLVVVRNRNRWSLYWTSIYRINQLSLRQSSSRQCNNRIMNLFKFPNPIPPPR